MRLHDAITEYEYACAGLSTRTQEWYSQKLRRWEEWMAQQPNGDDLEAVTPGLVRRYLAEVRVQPSPRTGRLVTGYTVHGYAQVIKGFLSWAVREELLPDRFSKRIQMPRVEHKVIATFSPSQVDALFKAAEREDTPALVARTKAILAVLLDTGIRASELCGLRTDHVTFTSQTAYIRVRGKASKEREIGMGREARLLLHRYITRYRQALIQREGDDGDAVFLTRSGRPLSIFRLDAILYELRDRAHITGVRVSAHTFRHTAATQWLQAGGNVVTLMHRLGHSHIQTTMLYAQTFQHQQARDAGLSVLDRMRSSRR